MSLRLPDRWVWDFWLARDGADHHLFFLQAPRSIGDPDLRHWNVSIGHAVSSDLVRWELLPDALVPAGESAWDDYTTWTGSVIRHDGLWWMFYTGTSHRENGRIQRVGAATSEDLMTWRRHGSAPLIESDPRWYEQYEPESWHELAWRDPWVFRDDQGMFHMLVTARAREGAPATRGVVGHAQSTDLENWTARPPVTTPGRFGHLEIPQVERVGTAWRLIFSAPGGPDDVAATYPVAGSSGTHMLSAPSPLGPFDWSTHELLDGDRARTRYGGRLVDTGAGWRLLTWLEHDADGKFVGELADPVPVHPDRDGLRVGRPTPLPPPPPRPPLP